jgi:hypothetical protein
LIPKFFESNYEAQYESFAAGNLAVIEALMLIGNLPRGQIKWVKHDSIPPRSVKHWVAAFGFDVGSGFDCQSSKAGMPNSTSICPQHQY